MINLKVVIIIIIMKICGQFKEKDYLNHVALNLGPHDRNFLVRSKNENFLRDATERNTR